MESTEQLKHYYNNKKIVSAWSQQLFLFLPEIFLLKKVMGMPDAKILDIGVGAGRTSYYFIHFVKEYVGIDYAQNMIAYCENFFERNTENIRFVTANVLNLDEFPSDYYDVVLFSYNGIDHIGHIERTEALTQIKKVCKPDGIISFSSHNLNTISHLKNFTFSWNPVKLFRETLTYVRHNYYSYNKKNNENYSIVRDRYVNFNNCYYVKPRYQVEQLQELQLKNIKTLSVISGKALTDEEMNLNEEAFLYYICNK